VGGLSGDSVILHHDAGRAFPEVKLIDFDSATSGALKRLHPNKIEHVWESASGSSVKILKHEGFFIDHRRLQVPIPAEKVFKIVSNMGRRHDWPYANRLWKLRGFFGIRKFEPADGYDYYTIDNLEENRRLLLYSQLKAPGEGWMEWQVTSNADGTLLEQTAYFTPSGLGGFLYWWLLFPFHTLVFRGLISKIAQKSLL
jgi:hypothetical protein